MDVTPEPRLVRSEERPNMSVFPHGIQAYLKDHAVGLDRDWQSGTVEEETELPGRALIRCKRYSPRYLDKGEGETFWDNKARTLMVEGLGHNSTRASRAIEKRFLAPVIEEPVLEERSVPEERKDRNGKTASPWPDSCPPRLLSFMGLSVDRGCRVLPWVENGVTGMCLDGDAKMFFTGPLRGCSVYVASSTGPGPETCVFHANANDEVCKDTIGRAAKFFLVGKLFQKTAKSSARSIGEESKKERYQHTVSHLFREFTRQYALRVTHELLVHQYESESGRDYHAFCFGEKTRDTWTFYNYRSELHDKTGGAVWEVKCNPIRQLP